MPFYPFVYILSRELLNMLLTFYKFWLSVYITGYIRLIELIIEVLKSLEFSLSTFILYGKFYAIVINCRYFLHNKQL